MEASRLYLSKAKRSYPIQPDTIRSSHPSPRKAKALNRLSTPRTREDNNMNNTVDTFGSRVIMPSKIEETYADILDDISDEVYVPSYMRQKMISAIIETENPKAYQMMKHFKAPFMTCSNEKKARMQRHKPLMCKPRTLNKDPRKFQTICAQDKISSQDIFTEKLIKVSTAKKPPPTCTVLVNLDVFDFLLHHMMWTGLTCYWFQSNIAITCRHFYIHSI